MKPPPPLDPTWWETPKMRAVLARQDVRAVYRWLLDHGWSQTAISARTGQTQPEVSEFLHSDRRVICWAGRAGIGWSGRGGCSCRARCGRWPL